MLVVYLPTCSAQTHARAASCLECQPYSYDFQRVCEEDGGDPGDGTAKEAAEGCFFLGARNHCGADLFVREEFYAGVGEDAEERRRVSAEETAQAVFLIDFSHGGDKAEP